MKPNLPRGLAPRATAAPSPPSPSQSPRLPAVLRRGLRGSGAAVAASIGVAAVSVWLLRAGALPLVPPRSALAAVSLPGLAAYVLLVVLTLSVRALRWHYLLLPLTAQPPSRLLHIGFAFQGANLILPLRLGELIRPALLSRAGRIPMLQALSLSAAERIIDGAVTSVLLVVGLSLAPPLDPLPERIGNLPIPVRIVPQLGWTGAVLFGTALAAIVLFHRFRYLAERILSRLLSPLSPRLASVVARTIASLAEGLRFLTHGRHTLHFLLATLAYWACNAASLWLVLVSCGLEGVSPLHALVVLGVLALGLMLPGAPGFFGAFQISIYAAMATFVPPEVIGTTGAVAVFWTYSLQVGCLLVCFAIGVWGLWRDPAMRPQAPPGSEASSH